MTDHIDHLLKILERNFPSQNVGICTDIYSSNGERSLTYFVHTGADCKMFHDIIDVDKYVRQFENLTVDAVLEKGGM